VGGALVEGVLPLQKLRVAGGRVLPTFQKLEGAKSHDSSSLRANSKKLLSRDEGLSRSSRALTPPQCTITSKEDVNMKDY